MKLALAVLCGLGAITTQAAPAFPDVMQSISTQYRLVYASPDRNTSKFRKIKVEAFRIVNDKREDFKVLVREGWR